MWKGNHPSLPSNEAGSLRRLTSLVKKLRSQGILERSDQVIQDQIKAGIVELLTGSATGQRHFYIPHKRVVRDSAETTKLRVVYDASVRTYSGAPSLNECLNPDRPVRRAKLRSSKPSLERPLQHLYPLELSCDSTVETTTSGPVDTQVVRPQRNTAAAARLRIEDIATVD